MPGLFGRMVAPMRRAAAGVPSYGMIPPLGSVQSASGLLVSQATAMTVPAVYGCVRIISQDVARCRATLYEQQKDGSRAVITDHPISRILKRPNRVQTWYEFCRDLMAAFLLRGNGYAAILRDRRGDPVELVLINPDAVMVLEAADGEWFYNVNRIGLFQIAMLADLPVAIPAEDIFHLRGISFNMLIGASTIGLARDAIGLAMGQSQQASRWIANGARPSVVLETPRILSDDAARRLKQSWNDMAGGLQNVGGTAILEEGLTAKELKLTAVDLQFIDQANLGVQDICRIWGVPPRKLGQPDLSRGAQPFLDEQIYINTTIAPLLDMIEQRLEREFDLDREGLSIGFDSDRLLRADPMTRYNLGRIGVLSGLLAPNVWRRGEKLPPAPGGDEVRAPVNIAALGSDMTGTAPDEAGRPPAGHMPKPGVPNVDAGNDPDDDASAEA
jgi:HK97 family phage portal protein